MASSAKKPTIILVPGAWHPPTCFSPLHNLLLSAGYTVEAIALPTVGANPPLPDFSADVAAIRQAIVRATDAGDDVVLVLHSYGGIPGGEAAKGFSREDRAAQGKAGAVVSIVWLTAFACEVGENLVDAKRGVHGTFLVWTDSGHVITKDNEHTFCNDLDPEVAARHIAELQPQSPGALMSRQTYAAWKDIPSTYVLCELDNCNEVEGQERMCSQAAGRWTVVRLRAGHLVFLSMPKETARVVMWAASCGTSLLY